MIYRRDLKKIAKTRLSEAKLLYQNKFYDGSAYLCGYVVETALKARICKLLKLTQYPDDLYGNMFKIHKFDQLLVLSGLSSQITPSNPDLFNNWNLVTNWNPEQRYQPIGSATKQYSEDLIKAIEDPISGVLTWLKKIW